MSQIEIKHANQGNLKNISLSIPRNQLVVVTGVSGSGKSTLLLDVLFQECQRRYLEALTMEGIHKPNVESIKHLSPAIAITQTHAMHQPRSTLGTITHIYTDLRMLYEKLSVRICPNCHQSICSGDCKEITSKVNKEFHVDMECPYCHHRMDKLTRSHFSFNTKEGACPTCEGLGQIHTIDQDKVVEETLSLEEGAILFWERQYAQYQRTCLYTCYQYFDIPIPKDLPINQYSTIQKEILFHGVESELVKQSFPNKKLPKTVSAGKFEGIYPMLWRRLKEKDGAIQKLPYFTTRTCPDCHGERLHPLSREVTILDKRLPELSQCELTEVLAWVHKITNTLSPHHKQQVQPYLDILHTKLSRYIKVGLGYLTLDRQTITLSGGELQRIRLAAVLDSELSGILYILDEPTIGLHPSDTKGLIDILRTLRDHGNSILVIEHDEDVMKAADHIIEMGYGSGQHGGEVIAQGSLDDILQNKASPTGQYLSITPCIPTTTRHPQGEILIQNASTHNLKQVNVSIPTGCLVSISGPSGSGKSTLIFDVLANAKQVKGLEKFDQIIQIQQSTITKMKRSNVATYTEVYALIRAVFAKTKQANDAHIRAKHFSFNTPGGRCEHCEGLGYIENNLLFYSSNMIVCPTCHGQQFHDDILAITYKGKSIKDVLDMSIEEACIFFQDQSNIQHILGLLMDIGLGYLPLNQTIPTLSNGECQRLKLAKELIKQKSNRKTLYLMDEPTTGLHPKDVGHFLSLLHHIVDAGHSVIVVEHNQQILRNSDWIIDLGPHGGSQGGSVIFTGTPAQLQACTSSITAQYI